MEEKKTNWGRIALAVLSIAFAVFVLAQILRIDRTVKDFLQDPFSLGVRAIDTVYTGVTANDGTGMPIKTAFGVLNKVVILVDSLDLDSLTNAEVQVLRGVTGVEEGVSMVEWNSGIEDNYIKALQAAGSSIKVGSAMGFYPRVDHTLYDGKALWTLFYLSDTTDVTGVGYMLSTQGNYTADNYNGFAIYSVSGTTYTKIDSTANDGNLWKTAANTTAVKAFSAGPHELNPGIYYVFLVYNNSAQTTAPKLYYNNDLANAAFAGLTGTNKIQGVVNSQTTPPATETGGDVTADLEIPAIWLY